MKCYAPFENFKLDGEEQSATFCPKLNFFCSSLNTCYEFTLGPTGPGGPGIPGGP